MTNAAIKDKAVSPVLKVCELTHGTLEVRDLNAARDFYENALGLRSVQHAPVSLLIGGEGSTVIVGVKAANRENVQGEENRWLILVGSADTVRDLHSRTASSARIAVMGDLIEEDGETSFRVQDGDGNWWEVSSRSESEFQEYFERGDVA